MKNPLNQLAAALFLSASVQAATAYPAGQIVFSGRIIPSTCTVSVDRGVAVSGEAGRAAGNSVNIGSPLVSELRLRGESPAAPFTLVLTGCPSSSGQEMKLTLEGDSHGSNDKLFKHSGSAKGVALRLESEDNSVIAPNQTYQKSHHADARGIFSIPMKAYIVPVGVEPLTAGSITATASVRLSYD